MKNNCVDCNKELKTKLSKRCKSCNSYFTGNLTNFGSKNANWKGDGASYVAKHIWMVAHFGKPTKCEKCGKDGLSGKRINWANISGKYLRVRKDWIRLCRPCHTVFDDIINRGWVTRREEQYNFN